jgi:hypothetical protein
MAAKTKTANADALARFESADNFDPKTARDARDTADIRAAVHMRESAQHMVDEAVIAGRRDRGLTWIEIAAALGVSPQAARQKYREHV